MSSLPFLYRTLSGPGQPRQIRLVTILPDEWGATLNLELEHVDINLILEYEYLSYAWGENECDRSITLNNSSFVVSSTLHIALEHLRHPSQERKIWIEAVCINQADIFERNAQVAIMGLIYSNATRVVVWIGLLTESSELAMEFLDMMATGSTDENPHTQSQERFHVAGESKLELRIGEDWHRSEWLETSSSVSRDQDQEPETAYVCKLGTRSSNEFFEPRPGIS